MDAPAHRNKTRSSNLVLKAESFRNYIESFNKSDDEQVINYVDNKSAWPWLEQNIPFFESSDKDLEEMYYFRWWAYRKHIKQTPDGFVVTEFLPDISGEGKWNTSSKAAAQHFYEGRWLRDHKYLKDYAYFWFRKGGEPRRYSFPAADALRAWAMVTQDQQLVAFDLLSELVANYREWEKSNLDPEGLFWQTAENDGMAGSVSGTGYRTAINSYMYGEAAAISEIASWCWRGQEHEEFKQKASHLRWLIEENLWDDVVGCYTTMPRANLYKQANGTPYTLWLMKENRPWVDVRELSCYLPWCFNLPYTGREKAWKHLMDAECFNVSCGLATVERRTTNFSKSSKERQWNGASWPTATAQTLTAMANLLNNYKQDYVSKNDYLELLRGYARSQHLKNAGGEAVPFFDEAMNPENGKWLAGSGAEKDRGRYCNSATFNDLIISGLVGLRPRMDHAVEVNPLAPESEMDYFCLDGVRYHGVNLTILWDKTGKRYHKGKGLRVFADGQELAAKSSLECTVVELPQTSAGWQKYEDNPVVGANRPVGDVGAMFDVEVLQEGDKYWMYGSWRPNNSIALMESTDGIHWSTPEVVLTPGKPGTWESADVSRATIVKRDGLYHLWYTGWNGGYDQQGKSGWFSYIGYATSPDGRAWKRMSDKPVLAPDLPWEGSVVMCANVIWDEEETMYKMWYTAGFKGIEPCLIGYATSPDGFSWTKHPDPVLVAEPANIWEQDKVTACHVFKRKGWYYMAYIGFRDTAHPQIGLARSKDGITNWERHPDNPIIRPGQTAWDQDACFKPLMRFDGKRWLLWYNGGHAGRERMGLAIHEGEDLGF